MGFKFLNFPKPKIEQNDFECQWNIDYDSYAVDCLSSGHVCHVRTMLYVRFSIFQRVFYLITVMLFVQIEPLLSMMVVVSDDESLPELKYL